jgi:hypothetical protein
MLQLLELFLFIYSLKAFVAKEEITLRPGKQE